MRERDVFNLVWLGQVALGRVRSGLVRPVIPSRGVTWMCHVVSSTHIENTMGDTCIHPFITIIHLLALWLAQAPIIIPRIR